jgi:hypothetical protein
MYDFNQASSHIIYEANDQGNHEEDIMQLLLVKLAKSKVYHKKSFAEKKYENAHNGTSSFTRQFHLIH